MMDHPDLKILTYIIYVEELDKNVLNLFIFQLLHNISLPQEEQFNMRV